MGRGEINELTPVQKKAFNNLKTAYKECIKQKIYFSNNYGSLTAWDGNLVNGYSDRETDLDNPIEEPGNSNCLNIANEWADDDHFIGLTTKGLKAYEYRD